MAKKTSNSSAADELDKELFGDVSTKSSSTSSTPSSLDTTSGDSAAFSDFSLDTLGEGPVEQPYKYLQIEIHEQDADEYLVYIHHQSHGFLNYMVSKMLKLKGIEFAAYKITSLDPPQIFIKLHKGNDIKVVLKETIKQMQIEMKGLRNAISALRI